MRIKRHVLAAALSIAAEQYARDQHTSECTPGHDRLALAFKDQARRAREYATAIDCGATITLED